MARFDVQYDNHAAAITLQNEGHFSDTALAAAERAAQANMHAAFSEVIGVHAAYDARQLASMHAASVLKQAQPQYVAMSPTSVIQKNVEHPSTRRGESFEQDGELIIIH